MTILDSYARWWRMTGRAEATVSTYLYTLRAFARDAFEGDEGRLPDACRDDLERYVDARMRNVSPASAVVDVRAFRSFYGWLADEGEVPLNPAMRLRHPKVPEPPVTVATELDLTRLLGACEKDTKIGRRDAAIIALLGHGGLRRGEVVVLDLEHVDMDLGTVQVPRTKTGKPRRVPLHPVASQRLDRWIRKRGPAPGALFPGYRSPRLSSNGIGQMVERRATAAGIDVTAHAFRRGLATRWLAEGGSEVGLQAIAGWTSTAMVARYTRMNREELAHAEYRRLMA